MVLSYSSRISAFFTCMFVLAVASVLNAAPLEQRDVYVPPVIDPQADTVWVTGQTYNVTWDTSNPPTQITNSIGFIVLRNTTSFVTSGPGSLDEPLASNFSILQGFAEVTVPDVPSGSYAVVLFGDSGNDSQYFTISQASDDGSDAD